LRKQIRVCGGLEARGNKRESRFEKENRGKKRGQTKDIHYPLKTNIKKKKQGGRDKGPLKYITGK